ncbi:hypothetical protein BGX26_000130 [Mortierella sp. AD094]|nr:hypothetical protein BGX26_000130 [Mortierella sp. AD094]
MDTLHSSRRKSIANAIATTITAAAAGPVVHAVAINKTTASTTTTTDGARRNHQEVKQESHVHVEYHNPKDEHMMKYIMTTTEVSQKDAVRKILSSQTSFKDPLMMKYTMSGPESQAEPNHGGRPGVHADSLREKLNQLQQQQYPNSSASRSPSPLRLGRVSPGRVSPSGPDHHQDNNVHHHHHHQHSRSRSGSNSSLPHHCVDIASCINSCSSSDKLVDDHTYRVNSSRPASRSRTPKDTYNEIAETIDQLHHDLELEKDTERQLLLSFGRRHRQQMNPELLKEYNNNLKQRHGNANLGHS